jgi:ABC-type nickel/cobalt efflux system permease component RcnA
VMTWVYAFPAWSVLIAAVVAFASASAAVVIVVRACVTFDERRRHNDVAGPIAGIVGTILAVLLSFTLVTVWQEYDQAAQSAFDEASAVSDLCRVATLLPEPTRGRLGGLLRQYASVVVRQEWPLMRDGKTSPEAAQLIDRVMGVVATYHTDTASQNALQSAAIGLAGAAQDARRNRLFDNQQGIPAILWAGLLFLVSAMLLTCGLFYMQKLSVHAVLAAGLGGVVATVLVLTAEFDYPFRGDIQIPPAAWQSVALPPSI